MENKNLIGIIDELQDATALLAFFQQTTEFIDSPMNEQSKNGLFLFVTEILDRLNKIQNSISTLY